MPVGLNASVISATPGSLATGGAFASGGLAAVGAGSSQPRPKNAKEAATQFEGLLIASMLRSAHEASPGRLDGDDEDSQSSTLFDLAAEQFSQMLAKQGGFGIARIVTSGLSRKA
jgi:Rod binding domain-containing protein